MDILIRDNIVHYADSTMQAIFFSHLGLRRINYIQAKELTQFALSIELNFCVKHFGQDVVHVGESNKDIKDDNGRSSGTIKVQRSATYAMTLNIWRRLPDVRRLGVRLPMSITL